MLSFPSRFTFPPLVEQFNPYHGKDGRFTSGGNASSVTWRPDYTEGQKQRIAEATGVNAGERAGAIIRGRLEKVDREFAHKVKSLEKQGELLGERTSKLSKQARKALESGDQKKYLQLKTKRKEVWDKFDKVAGQLSEQHRTRIETLRAEIYVDKAASFKVHVASRLNTPRKEALDETVPELRKLIGTGSVDGATLTVKAGGRGRSFGDERSIDLSTSARHTVIAHEVGHWLEGTDSEVHRKALDFYTKRTQGEALQPMGDRYAANEQTRRDSFIHAYMGKEYKLGGRQYATEIVSMGLQYLHSDPLTLARKDPTYFDFMVGLLRGH